MHLTWFCNQTNRLCFGAGIIHPDQDYASGLVLYILTKLGKNRLAK